MPGADLGTSSPPHITPILTQTLILAQAATLTQTLILAQAASNGQSQRLVHLHGRLHCLLGCARWRLYL